MSESRFIKTVSFGGYDKADVEKKLESMYSQVFDLKNELRETKLLIEEYRKGTSEEKAQEAVLSGERAKLTSVQVQKESLSDKLKIADDDIKAKDKEIEKLKSENDDLKKKLEDAESKLKMLEAGGDAASLGSVFIEAQKAADMVKAASKADADKMESDAKKVVQNMIDDANNKASVIVYEAEKKAAEIEADSVNKAEQMKAASGNLRATVLSDVENFMDQMSKIRAVFENFEDLGITKVQESEKLLERAKKKLTEGGVPVFTDPKKVEPDLPAKPELKPVDHDISGAGKKNEELDKLMAMAQAIGSDDKSAEKPDKKEVKPEDKKEEKKDSAGSVSLEDLMKQAASIS